MKIKVLSVFGTRPEVLKMAPVLKELDKYSLELLEIIKNGGLKLKSLILNFLNVPQSKEKYLQKEKCNLVRIIKQCVDDFKFLYAIE